MESEPDQVVSGNVDHRRDQRRNAARERAIGLSSQAVKLTRAMSDDPSSINGFGHGGEHARDLAVQLIRSVPKGIFFYQRRLGLRNHDDPIDLVAVVPSGVWVIDIQQCGGGRVHVSGRQGVLSSRYTHVMIRGRDRTAYLDRLVGQARAVQEALETVGRGNVPVHPAFCFVDALTVWRGTPEIGSALLTRPKRLASMLLHHARVMSDVEVASTAQALGQKLPRQHIRD
jgi:nuclease-like protein